MDKKKQLLEQLKIVINSLEKDYAKDVNSGILELIYRRYRRALKILENDRDIKEITIIGGVRAYLDSHSDYQNPLLEELHVAEKLSEELLGEHHNIVKF